MVRMCVEVCVIKQKITLYAGDSDSDSVYAGDSDSDTARGTASLLFLNTNISKQAKRR